MATNKTTAVSRYNVMATFNSGKAGNVRLYNKGQRTYIRAAHNSIVNNPQTLSQMKTRLMLASRSQYWSMLRSIVKGCFIGSTNTVSDCNHFNRINKNVGCYFTKEEMFYKPSALMPLQITSGNLGVMETAFETDMTGGFVTYCKKIKFTLGDSGFTNFTIKAISENLLSENDWLREGDKITMIFFESGDGKKLPSGETIPSANVSRVAELVINTKATGMGPFGFVGANASALTVGSSTYLGASEITNEKGAVAIIVSRNVNGKRRCTTSFITAPSFDEMKDRQTSASLDRARTSYLVKETENGSANADGLANVHWDLSYNGTLTDAQKKLIADAMPTQLPIGNRVKIYAPADESWHATFYGFEGVLQSSGTTSVTGVVYDGVILRATMAYVAD